jgi:hypothetical protein
MNAEPVRIWEARKARGHANYKNLCNYLKMVATDKALASLGLHKEMTKERREGTIKNPDKQTVQ